MVKTHALKSNFIRLGYAKASKHKINVLKRMLYEIDMQFIRLVKLVLEALPYFRGEK